MTRAQRTTLHVFVALTAISGMVFAWMKYAMHTDDPFAVANHPLQPKMLAIHVIAAPVLVFAFGWIFNDHVAARYRSRAPNRFTGLWSAVLFAAMTLSAYFLQVSTSDATQKTWRVTHWVTSGLFALFYLVHFIRGRAIARSGGRAA